MSVNILEGLHCQDFIFCHRESIIHQFISRQVFRLFSRLSIAKREGDIEVFVGGLHFTVLVTNGVFSN
jgi:hypothetical protein